MSKYSKSIAGISQLNKEKNGGIVIVQFKKQQEKTGGPKIKSMELYNKKHKHGGGGIIVYIVLPNSQQLPYFGRPFSQRHSMCMPKTRCELCTGVFEAGYSRCRAPLTIGVEFYPKVLPSAYCRQPTNLRTETV